jgi:hypothetical protein
MHLFVEYDRRKSSMYDDVRRCCQQYQWICIGERLFTANLFEMIFSRIFETCLYGLKRKTNDDSSIEKLLIIFVMFDTTWFDVGVDVVACLSRSVTESSDLTIDVPWIVLGDDKRIVLAILGIRMELFSCDDDRRVRNDDPIGDRLVPVEFGGVRWFIGLSSVYMYINRTWVKKKTNLPLVDVMFAFPNVYWLA